MDQALANAQVQTFLDDLASNAATPGGGAAAALVGAMAAGLVSMVCSLTVGRARYVSVESAMQSLLARAETLRRTLTDLADDDSRAYAGVASAYRQPKTTEAEIISRQRAIQQALRTASAPPLAAMEAARAIVPLCLQVAAHGNSTVVSDAGVAAELAVASVRSSMINLRVNLKDLKDRDYVADALRRIALADEGLTDDLYRVEALVRAKLAPKATG